MGQIANRQSLLFSERSQLSQAIPQVHVEQILHQRNERFNFQEGVNLRFGLSLSP